MKRRVYVRNEDLLNELNKSKLQDRLTPEAIKMFQRMIKECSKTLHYKDPMDKEDCMSEAMSDILRYWRSFNSEISSNAFAYFTSTIKKGFAKGWRKLHNIKTVNIVYINEETGIFNI